VQDPTPTLTSVGPVTSTTAQINGTIDPKTGKGSYRIDYGPTAAYGSSAPATGWTTVGFSLAPVAFVKTLTGLTPNTTYHFRIVANSTYGTTPGADGTFTTAP